MKSVSLYRRVILVLEEDILKVMVGCVVLINLFIFNKFVN